MGNRWRYSQDFKRKALQLVAHEDVSRTQISKDLEINPNMLRWWGSIAISQGIVCRAHHA